VAAVDGSSHGKLPAVNTYAQHFVPFVSSIFLTFSSIAALRAQPPPGIGATDAWIRWLPANVPSAGYITLANKGTVPQVLIGASSTDYGEITLHQSRNIDGMSGMAPVDAIKVGPKTSVNFLRQGYHLMLTQPHRSVGAGERVPITLRFLSGQSMSVQFVVRAADAGANAAKTRAPILAAIP
jgi:copper(I)-binding protein